MAKLTDNLLAYYKLEGSSVDALGAYNGTDTNVTYDPTYGKIGQGGKFIKAVSLSHIDTALKVPSGTNPKSFSIWFKPTAGLLRGWLIDNRGATSSAGRHFGAFLNTNGVGDLYFFGYSTADMSIGTVTATWNHLVVTYNGTTVKAYLNGGSVVQANKTLNSTLNATLEIGRWDSDSSWDGYIDEVGFWSRELTATEAKELYNNGMGLSYPFNTTNFFQFI